MMELKELLVRAYEIGLTLLDEHVCSFTAEELTEIFRYRYRCRIPHEKYGYKELEDMLDASDLFQRCLGKRRWPLYKCTPKKNYKFQYKIPVRPHYDDLESDEMALSSPDITDHDFSLLKKPTVITKPLTCVQPLETPVETTGLFSRMENYGYQPISVNYITPETPDVIDNNYPLYDVKQWLDTCSSHPSPIPSPLHESSSNQSEKSAATGGQIKDKVSRSVGSMTDAKASSIDVAPRFLRLRLPAVKQELENRLPMCTNNAVHVHHSSEMDICSTVSHDSPSRSSAGLCPTAAGEHRNPTSVSQHEGKTNNVFSPPIVPATVPDAVISATRKEEFEEKKKHEELGGTDGRKRKRKRQKRKRSAVPANSSNAVALGSSRWERPDRREVVKQPRIEPPLPVSRAVRCRSRWESLGRRQEEVKQHWIRPVVPAAAPNAVAAGNRSEKMDSRQEINSSWKNPTITSSRPLSIRPTLLPVRSCPSIVEFATRLRDILADNGNIPLSLFAASNFYLERFGSTFSSDFCNNVAYGTTYHFLEVVSRGEIHVSSDYGLILFRLVPPALHVEDRGIPVSQPLLGNPPRENLGAVNYVPVPLNLYGRDWSRPVGQRPPLLTQSLKTEEQSVGWSGNWSRPLDRAKERAEAESHLRSLDTLLFHTTSRTFPSF